MLYRIRYVCLSHIGRIRQINQDNFICAGHYAQLNGASVNFPMCGKVSSKENTLFGVFDGMGGEECGEVAAYIAAKTAAQTQLGKNVAADLFNLCDSANKNICDYAQDNNVLSMGTTAAMLAFTEKEIALCNIGDSKILRLHKKKLEQISTDHVGIAAYGRKPPLSQNLGIPPSELLIEPYCARGGYRNGDIYLICSDGLTDMLSNDRICRILMEYPLQEAAQMLLNEALEQGGKDNITIILCKTERGNRWFTGGLRKEKR